MLVIGPYKNRVENVLKALIQDISDEETVIFNSNVHYSNSDDSKNIISQKYILNENNSMQINLELVPCVATFDQYYSSIVGSKVPYLKSMNYFNYYHEKKDDQPENLYSSLAPFFDNCREDRSNWGFVAAVAGCGIQKNEHLQMIQQFLNTMSFTNDKKIKELKVTTMPKHDYENQRQQDVVCNDISIKHPTGPHKMAQFILEEAKKAFELILEDFLRDDQDNCVADACSPPQTATSTSIVQSHQSTENYEDNIIITSNGSEKSNVVDNDLFLDSNNDRAIIDGEPVSTTTTKYACKICRLILFDQSDLQSPPHQRKRRDHHRYYDKFANNSNNPCESIFLSNPMTWMNQKVMNSNNIIQGKLNCPKCSTKIGSWNWSGAQCSCGSWVTPAIQILASRVDIILPIHR